MYVFPALTVRKNNAGGERTLSFTAGTLISPVPLWLREDELARIVFTSRDGALNR